MASRLNQEWAVTVRDIGQMLASNPNDWQSYLASARRLLDDIEASGYMNETTQTANQVWLIDTLQQLAFSEPDTGSARDIAEWCLRQWLTVLQTRPQNASALKGMTFSLLNKKNTFEQDISPFVIYRLRV